MLPAPLARAQRRWERWRAKRRVRTRLPEGMWTEAAALAVEHGHNRTARALRLDYYGLKRRLTTAWRRAKKPGMPGSAFVELVPTAGAICAVEIEDGSGARMRIEVKGAAAPDLAALCRAFRGAQG